MRECAISLEIIVDIIISEPQLEAHLQLTINYSRVKLEEFVHCQVRVNETDSAAKRQFSVRNRDHLMNAQPLHKW